MPGAIQGGASGFRRRDFVTAVRLAMEARGQKMREVLEDIGNETVAHLRAITPKDTGAAAGTTQGANRPIYKSHPGYRMGIGNEPGDTGWQLKWVNTASKFTIHTPMWDFYLKYVNYEGKNGNFVETAVREMRTKLKAWRK